MHIFKVEGKCNEYYTLIVFVYQESYNTNISQQLFDYPITFVNSKRDFFTQKPVLSVRLKDFWYTKVNPTLIWCDKLNL